MSRDQKIVAIGGASGVTAMLAATWLLYALLRPSTVDPLIYALRWQPLAALPQPCIRSIAAPRAVLKF